MRNMLLLLLLLFGLINLSSGSYKEEIHIGAFLTNIQEDVHCFKAAMQAAMKLITEDNTLLSNHKLVIHFIDNFVSYSSCSWKNKINSNHFLTLTFHILTVQSNLFKTDTHGAKNFVRRIHVS